MRSRGQDGGSTGSEKIASDLAVAETSTSSIGSHGSPGPTASSSTEPDLVLGGGERIVNGRGDDGVVNSSPFTSAAVDADNEALQQAMTGFTTAARDVRDVASNSANALIATAVGANLVGAAISILTSGTTATVTGSMPIAAAQQLLINGVATSGGVAAAATEAVVTTSGLLKGGVPTSDLGSLWMLLGYLQFVSSTSHLNLPGAPDFYYKFTDSLGWSNLQPISSSPVALTSPTAGKETAASSSSSSTTGLSSDGLGNFSVADGDIISGVLAYARRLNIEPQELFTKTAIVFASVVGGVAAVIATLYAAVRCLLGRRLELVVQRLDELPRAKLLLRLLTQSCLSICLMSEYALSMTSSFQMRYSQDQGEQQQAEGGAAGSSSSALAFATVALIVVCFGLLVLGVAKLWGKTEAELMHADFKFAWGPYYKYYHHRARYFFVPKMGAEILSGVVIGLVSHVPSQLSLLMAMQLAMFLFTVESAPYSMDFQTACAATAFVMKMLTYALISSFLTSSTDERLQDFVGTLVILLQVALLLLFNSRQLHILYKQMRFLWALRKERRRLERLERERTRREDREGGQEKHQAARSQLLPPAFEETPKAFGLLHSKHNSPASPVKGG